ncbi:hypothetical protein NR798_23825 [Archangium gephyra]|uniref:RCC1 domain-containing protein n=1 Tax=Archangium gephyra TaxID=48 RepID=UPI0035D49FF8
MFKDSVSMKVWGALSALSLLAGCGAIADDERAPAQVRQAVTSAANPIAAGRYHVLVVRNGSIWGWGYDGYGQLGDGTTGDANYNRASPIQLQVLDAQGAPVTFKSVAAAETHSLALDTNGKVWAFGYNNVGQLGLGTYQQSLVPVQVPNLSNVVAISAHTGSAFSMALDSDGQVWTWGYNNAGQLGDGTIDRYDRKLSPVKVKVQTTDGSVSYLNDVVSISAGLDHCLAIRSDGTVWGWGSNAGGKLFTPTSVTALYKAAQLPLPTGTTAVEVVAGYTHSLILLSDGTVWAGGFNTWGYLGSPTNPGRVNLANGVTLSGVSRLEVGKTHSAAITSTGVYAWGDNQFGQFGTGGKVSASHAVPTYFPGGYPALGEEFSAVLDGNGDVWTSGSNVHGRLGRLIPGVAAADQLMSTDPTPRKVTF